MCLIEDTAGRVYQSPQQTQVDPGTAVWGRGKEYLRGQQVVQFHLERGAAKLPRKLFIPPRSRRLHAADRILRPRAVSHDELHVSTTY
jgi:hypothetical protein